MPKLPRDLSQDEVIRALVRAGGVEEEQGKGSHRGVRMLNKHIAIIPRKVKVGLLASQLKQSNLSVDEFIKLL